MASTFAQRLDFLMRLTNTQNSMLARTLNFDASYISRIRSGRRGMPRHQPFVEPAAAYFAQSLTEPYQRKAVVDAILPGREWPEDEREATQLVTAWLRGDDEHDPIDRFLDELSALAQHAHTPTGDNDDLPPLPAIKAPPTERASFFYGNDGKRAAIKAFLQEMVTLEQPIELLLLSDEHLAWLHEDASFERLWSTLLVRIVSQGGKICIVHEVGRSLDQMLKVIESWLPLYVSGHIESWRYPRTRKGVHRRTLFLARDHAAIVSNSIGEHTDSMLNLLIRDARATRALEEEYNNYLALCKPLMHFDLLEDAADIAVWAREASRRVRADTDEVMLREADDDEFALLVGEHVGATIFRTASPAIVVTVEEPSLVTAFWEYLGRAHDVRQGRCEVAQRLDAIASGKTS